MDLTKLVDGSFVIKETGMARQYKLARKMKKIGIGRKSSALFRRKITVLIDYIFAVLCEHSQSVKKHHPQIIEGQVAASFKKTADLIADYTSALYYASLGEECVFIF